ncbi:leucine-rich repeat and fibronectin type III domain-containing protein 1 [Dromaius novaehollandiae]|uniref:leucine-rich repeat and fibronectin type III domain-containing protein 1 n=1 Tax=Dromaius novaehollandiae TaxID=8790 RepID=UPI00311E804E
MAKLLVSLVVLGAVTRPQAQPRCPGRCICPAAAPSPTLLCAKTGLLFVPPAIDRRTVELRLTDNFIAAVRRPDFANMSSLVHLTLSRNTISHVAPGAFADLRALRALHLDGNRLLALGGAQLRGLASLRRLIVANNQLGRVEAAAFAAFAATVEDLDLSYNNLASVPWEAIGAMRSLNTLTLDHNLLERVAPGALARLPKLARLDVTANRLRTLPEPGGGPEGRPSLALGGNPLHCNCELLWLRRRAPGGLETCATPARLADRPLWAVPEEDFVCQAPLITRARASAGAVLQGQAVSVGCAAAGDPPPALRWLAPDGRPVRNGTRRALRPDGTLELRAATLGDHGAFTCVASNAAGEAAAPVPLAVLPLPLPAARPPPPPAASPSDMARAGDGAGDHERRVVAAELTASSARIRWPAQRPAPGVRMYQIQYNSSLDDSLVYRMIPSSSKTFVVTDLAAGREYDLCVLALYEDGGAALPAARAVGCVRFATAAGGPRCPAARPHFLGGTIIIVIGGAIAASVLVFILILTVRYKAAGARRRPPAAAVHSVCSQTNGAHPPGAKHPDDPEAGLGAAPGPEAPGAVGAAGATGATAVAAGATVATAGAMVATGATVATAGATAGGMGAAAGAMGAMGGGGPPRQRHSFDGARGLFPSHSYPRRARTRLHGSASRLDAAPPPRRPAFGSTEWMLESTV